MFWSLNSLQFFFQHFIKISSPDSSFTKRTNLLNQKIRFRFTEKLIRGLLNMPPLSRLSLNFSINKDTLWVLATFWTHSVQNFLSSKVRRSWELEMKFLCIFMHISYFPPYFFHLLCLYILPPHTPFFSFHCPQLCWPNFIEIML